MSRFALSLGALALAVAAVAAAFLWQPGLDSLYDDSVGYLLMAQAFAPFHAAPSAVAAAASLEKFPPLFPLALAVSGGAYDWRIAHLVVAASFAASVLFLGLHARRVLDSPWQGWMLALVYAVMPGAWLNAKGILSEFPYMALAFATLAYHDRWIDRSPGRGGAAALGALLAATMLTRSIGVALLAALAYAEAVRYVRTRDAARLRVMAPPAALAIGAALAWHFVHPGAGDTYGSSATIMLEGTAQHGPGWLLAWALFNAASLADAWFNALLIFWGEPWRPQFLIAAALGIAGLGGSLVRAARGAADGAYCAIYLAILLLWPFPGQMYRLAFPVVPLLMVNAFWALRAALGRLGARRAERGAMYAAAAPLVLCLPALVFYVAQRARMPDAPVDAMRKTDIAEFYRIPSGPGAEANAREQIAVMADLRRVGETTPENARVMWYAPDYVTLLAGRRGVPLRRPATSAELAAQVRATGAGYLYVADVRPRDSLLREGDPMVAAALAAPLARGVWARRGADGEVRAILLKFDPDRIGKGERVP